MITNIINFENFHFILYEGISHFSMIKVNNNGCQSNLNQINKNKIELLNSCHVKFIKEIPYKYLTSKYIFLVLTDTINKSRF